jgi:hypothetical protein
MTLRNIQQFRIDQNCGTATASGPNFPKNSFSFQECQYPPSRVLGIFAECTKSELLKIGRSKTQSRA